MGIFCTGFYFPSKAPPPPGFYANSIKFLPWDTGICHHYSQSHVFEYCVGGISRSSCSVAPTPLPDNLRMA